MKAEREALSVAKKAYLKSAEKEYPSGCFVYAELPDGRKEQWMVVSVDGVESTGLIKGKYCRGDIVTDTLGAFYERCVTRVRLPGGPWKYLDGETL